jgi:two-component system response regulator RegA
VVLIDDDEPWLRMCERELHALGATVHTATTVGGALAIANSQPPDLVISEARIAGESGIALLDAVRAPHPQCKVVIVSAYLSIALTAALVRHGAYLVLCKPVHPSEILRQLPAPHAAPSTWVTPTLARAEWEHIHRVLADCNGNVSEAARRLGILRQSLQRRLRKHAPPH